MLGGTLTLLNRSIRGDALKPQAHAVRLLSLFLLLIFLLAAQVRASEFSAPGLNFFRSMAYLGMMLISLAGIGHFANSITEEKEEGTLGLLLLANISPLAILLGKSTNRVLSTILIFIAQFPFALLAITLGGISISQIFATYVALAGYLFLVANLALFASVISRKSSEAAAFVLLLLFLALGLIPAVNNSLRELRLRGMIADSAVVKGVVERCMEFHTETSILQQISRIFEPHGTSRIWSNQFVFSLLLGGTFFGMAWLWFRRIIWTPDSVEPQRVTARFRKRRWTIFKTRPWKLALAWKDYYFLAGGPLLFFMKVIFFPIWIGLCWSFSQEIYHITDATGGSFARDALLIILVVEVLLYASQFYQTERKLGTLPTLLMLPQSVGQISYAKLCGCLIATIPTLLAIFVSEWLILRSRRGEPLLLTETMLFGLCLLLVLAHLTVLCSLIAKWGALPLAFGIMLILGMVLVPFVAGAMELISSAEQGDFAKLSPLLYASGIVIAGIQLEIARRIRAIAGE